MTKQSKISVPQHPTRLFPIRVQLPHSTLPENGVTLSALEKDLDDYGVAKWYKTFDSMPQWVQTNVIKLQMLPDPPPIIDVTNVGRRINELVYWVAPPDEHTLGATAGIPTGSKGE